MKIGDEVFIHGYIDEIRKDTIIIKNAGGYFGTVREEITSVQSGAKMVEPQESEYVCEKCLYAEETDGSHCYECVKGESKFKAESEDEE